MDFIWTVAASFIFTFFGIIWTGSTWSNVFLKFVLIVMSLTGWFIVAQQAGYVVAVVPA